MKTVQVFVRIPTGSRLGGNQHVVDGIDAAPEAFIGMLEGRNFGKLIVKVA